MFPPWRCVVTMASDPDNIPCILLIDHSRVRGVETVPDLFEGRMTYE